mmetsp:Transcript_49099/g.158572  ORF Transcript_49099/g.158572 Transcript_49099/m.158572 type:complete len:307 (-) Transcript_49099:501-1421(-)
MSPLPCKMRSRVSLGALGTPSSLGAGGRAALSPCRGAGSYGGNLAAKYEDKHRAYLQKIQDKNLAERQLKEEEERRNSDKNRREAGFSVCFNGANNSGRRTSRASSARGQRDAGRCPFGGGGAGFGGAGGVDGVWGKQWEEKTVEIKGQEGEVYAVRPSGERKYRPPLAPPAPPAPQAEVRASSLGATQRELPELKKQLIEQGLVEQDSPRPRSSRGSSRGSMMVSDLNKVMDLRDACASASAVLPEGSVDSGEWCVLASAASPKASTDLHETRASASAVSPRGSMDLRESSASASASGDLLGAFP